MTEFSSGKQCDRCGARPAAGKLFRIPWTGDLLCKDCIDKDRSLQQILAEISSMSHDRRPHNPCPQSGLSDETDMLAYILEPNEK
ncbi:MAG: hypothetical protein IKL85_06935 [Lentisphaeria bacterium]|nr:hypothetical protein [Lentisphaeria bacterium]